jgi:hypothetical protein
MSKSCKEMLEAYVIGVPEPSEFLVLVHTQVMFYVLFYKFTCTLIKKLQYFEVPDPYDEVSSYVVDMEIKYVVNRGSGGKKHDPEPRPEPLTLSVSGPICS